MSGLMNKAASVAGPIAAADATGVTGVPRYASATSNTSVQIPAGMLGRFYKIMSNGVDTDYAFSLGAPATLVRNQTSNVGTGSAVAGDTVASGNSEQAMVPDPKSGVVYLNFISSATGGYVIFRCAETGNI